MRQPTLTQSRTRLTGVIDTLSNGFGVVNRNPWILLLPLLLDLFLWLGPQLSAARLVSRTLSLAAPLSGNAGAARWLDQAQQQEIVQAAEGFNLLSALAPSVAGVPSLLAALGIRDPLRSTAVETWDSAALIFLGSALLGVLLGSLYYAVVSQLIRGRSVQARRLAGGVVRAWGRVLLYLMLLGGAGLAIGVPIGFLVIAATVISPSLGSLVLSLATMILVWVGVYLYFVPDAIFISQVGPLRAVRNSVMVVRGSFWSAIGIILLVTILLLGMGQVWSMMAGRVQPPLGLGLAILGHAYIASGVIAASMSFYRERIEHLTR